jgi:hypothetical protein
MIIEPLSSNGCLLRFHHSGFQPPCHFIYIYIFIVNEIIMVGNENISYDVSLVMQMNRSNRQLRLEIR